MQRNMIIFTTACCFVLAALNFYLNYRLYSLTGEGELNESAVAIAAAPLPYGQQPFAAEITGAQGLMAEAEPIAASETDEAPLYRLGMKDGFITVYYGAGDGRAVKEITAIPADFLPFDEKLRLNDGIPVFNDAQLAQLLQDYGS